MRRLRAFALLGAICAALPGWARDNDAPSPAALWTADLALYGYVSPLPRNARDDGKSGDAGILFTRTGQVVCYFLVKQSAPVVLERRNLLSATDPFHVHVVIFDGRTGAMLQNHDLPARYGVVSVAATEQGGFLVRSGQTIILYDSEFRLLKARQLPRVTANSDFILDDVGRFSPTSRHFVWAHADSPFARVDIVDAVSLSSISTANDDNYRSFSISDRNIVRPDAKFDRIMLRGFQTGWKVIGDRKSLGCSADGLLFNPVLINDQEVVAPCGRKLAVLSTSGEILMRDEAERSEVFGWRIVYSADGRFFALPAQQLSEIYVLPTGRGFVIPIDQHPARQRLLVYDATARRRVASLKLDPVPQEALDFAISPDGVEFAVLADGHVKAFAVPSTN